MKIIVLMHRGFINPAAMTKLHLLAVAICHILYRENCWPQHIVVVW